MKERLTYALENVNDRGSTPTAKAPTPRKVDITTRPQSPDILRSKWVETADLVEAVRQELDRGATK